MAFLNESIPPIFCLLRLEYAYNLEAHHGEHVPCCLFGVASVFGRALGFHCLTENGAQFARLPISAFCWKPSAPVVEPWQRELWDCLGEQVSICAFRYLKGCRVKAFLPERATVMGHYLFTVDWCGEPYSDDPGDGGHKNAHLLQLDDGTYAALPNNRIQWLDAALVTKPFTERPDYLTNQQTWRAEKGDRWLAEASDRYFYGEQEDMLPPLTKG